MSKFYVIATPIGNMGDITLRAIETLKSVDLILCEDTRETKKILDKYNINKPTMSYHAQSKLSKTDKIFELLEAGKDLALVSDAGTPGISDPGAMLVSQIKEKFNTWTSNVQVEVVPIPGASAVITALSASGLPTHEFTFLGFLPHKKGRETLFKEIRDAKRTMVFYESPHRILKTLETLEGAFGSYTRVFIARELTKLYETLYRGKIKDVIASLKKEKVKGELTVVVEV